MEYLSALPPFCLVAELSHKVAGKQVEASALSTGKPILFKLQVSLEHRLKDMSEFCPAHYSPGLMWQRIHLNGK